jgi:outer membrane protein TolC
LVERKEESDVTGPARIIAVSFFTALLVAAGPSAAPAQAQQPQARDLTLAEAIALAAQQNQQLRVAAFEVVIARSQLTQARAGGGPQVNAQASYTRTKDAGPTVIDFGFPIGTIELPAPSPNLYDARLILQYPLYTGGRLEAQIALAEANVKGAEASLERAKQQIVFGVRQAYFQLLLAQAGLEVADRSITQAAENLRVARARVAAGASPRFDEVQADVAVAQARQSQVRARNGIAQATQGLNALINLPLNTPLRLRDALAVRPVGPAVDALIVRALETRPEFAELRARQSAAQAAIALAESGAKPTVALSSAASYGNQGSLFSTGASTNWSITLAATLNLYDGGLTKERINEARQRLEQLRAGEAAQRQAVELEVRQAFLNLQSASEELGGADALISQAQEALRIANVRFQSGVGTTLEVLTAQVNTSQAEGARAQALFNYNFARATLERAVGADIP